MLAAIFSACCRTIFRSVPTIRTAIGVDEPKLITVVTMSPGSKPNVDSLACRSASVGRQSPLLKPLGQPRNHVLGQDVAQPLAELVELDSAVLRERDSQLAVVGPAHEQHHVVDAEVRCDLPDVAHRDLDVLGLRLALDLLQTLERHLPRQLEVRAGRRPEPQHELARIDLRKQLRADLQPRPARITHTCHQIDRHRQPARAGRTQPTTLP